MTRIYREAPCKHGHMGCAFRAGGACFDEQVNAAAGALVLAYFKREAERRNALRGRLGLTLGEVAAICNRHGLLPDEHEAATDQAAEEYREAAQDRAERMAEIEASTPEPLDQHGPWGAP